MSRGLGVTAAALSGWYDAFLTAGKASLTTRQKDGEELESHQLKAKLGNMLLKTELLEAKIAVLEDDRSLWSEGGRGQEGRDLTLERQALQLGPGVPSLEGGPVR